MSHRPRICGDIVDALLARPQGLTAAEGCDACPSTELRAMCKHLQHLVDYGKAWSAKIPGSLAHRWFATQAARDAWATANPQRPSRKAQQRARKLASGPTLSERLMAVVQARGGHGTLACDLAEGINQPRGVFGNWVSKAHAQGRLNCVMHKGTRIFWPAGMDLLPGALQACQRRIERELATRRRRGKYTVVPGKPGAPAGVTLPARRDWRAEPASNAGQVVVQVCPAPRFDHRYQVDPAQMAAGGFSRLKPGQYDMPASHAVAQVLAVDRFAGVHA